MRISLSDEAMADFEAATDWYLDEQAFIAADDLADEMEYALALLQKFPEIGKAASDGTRAFVLRKFPFSLIYRVQPDHIRVVAVVNHSRRPGFWVGRP